ncbi:fimbrial protein [Aquitalea sp.]|uniref:fimbrial protein n=1 Tax=Aquitalea sp. TaxID=1872623 RepID=UPI002590CB2B|nr:fimbrial protein [Aquitalea sp.]
MKNLVKISLFIAAGVIANPSNAAATNSGQISFTGSIGSSTCLIDGELQGFKTVDFGSLQPSEVPAAGATPVPFTLTISGDAASCNKDTVSIAFNPNNPNIDKPTGNLKLNGPLPAGNVGIELAAIPSGGGAATKIRLGGSNGFTNVTITPAMSTTPTGNRSGTANLQARLVRVDPSIPPTPGSIFSQIDYVLVYQ